MNYDDRHAALVTYLLAKVEERDWHGVSDAANDLRVLEAKAEATSAAHDAAIARDAARDAQAPERWHAKG